MVELSDHRAFVVADIPGLIEGAAEGAGLGHQFLRHLQRTHLLLHLLDLGSYWLHGEGVDYCVEQVVRDAIIIANELARYDSALAETPRWLVLNKCDLIPADAIAAMEKKILAAYKKQTQLTAKKMPPCFVISAMAGKGLPPLIHQVADFLQSQKSKTVATPDNL